VKGTLVIQTSLLVAYMDRKTCGPKGNASTPPPNKVAGLGMPSPSSSPSPQPDESEALEESDELQEVEDLDELEEVEDSEEPDSSSLPLPQLASSPPVVEHARREAPPLPYSDPINELHCL
jgi:hypothetical protein